MSASPRSPSHGPFSTEQARVRKRDRPPALELGFAPSPQSAERRAMNDHNADEHDIHPRLHVSSPDYPPDIEPPRSTSATSSLDPYYYGAHTPSEEAAPTMLPDPSETFVRTPEVEYYTPKAPVTPVRDPSAIDRRGLVGLGELSTPRWAQSERTRGAGEVVTMEEVGEEPAEELEQELEVVDLPDAPDSPWTIEAVEKEGEERSEPEEAKQPHTARPLRTRRSLADESGGEEILYPRKPQRPDVFTHSPLLEQQEPADKFASPVHGDPSSGSGSEMQTQRQRPSAELGRSASLSVQSSGTVSGTPSKSRVRDEKASARKHRSLALGEIPPPSTPRDRARDKRRESLALNLSGNPKASPRHARTTSASSSSSSHNEKAQRRAHNSDFSHLPPSPSSLSIQHLLRHPTAQPTTAPSVHSSPNVGQSLLRGTQEGWSSLDDEATTEALRKLDGVSGKAARARTSFGSTSRPTSSSRPGTPGSHKGTSQWEGIEGSSRRKSNSHIRESLRKESEVAGSPTSRQSIGLGLGLGLGLEESAIATDSADEPTVLSPAQDKPSKKSGTSSARSSFTPKRGSSSFTQYTGTTVASSRDSAQLSVGTSATSLSGTSGRFSANKSRRNSAGSDMSAHSTDVASLRDRAAALVGNGDVMEEDLVPPVPPLPKDLSGYRSPPQSSSSQSFPTVHHTEGKGQHLGEESDPDRTVSFDAAPLPTTPHKPTHQHAPVQDLDVIISTASPPSKTPARKWSFNALSLGLRSPSSKGASSQKAPKPSPLHTSSMDADSGEQMLSPASASAPKVWQQPAAMGSASSLASMSSVGSVRGALSPGATAAAATSAQPGSEDRLVPSRAETVSSADTSHTTGGLSAPAPTATSPSSTRRNSSKRLTPSSIPFFRRSSSQSMQMPPPPVPSQSRSDSPTMSSGPDSSMRLRIKPVQPSIKDNSVSSPSTPGSAHKKSSVLSLGALLKGSSSRKSFHSERSDFSTDKDSWRGKDGDAQPTTSKDKSEREKQGKDDKDRSESRISALMGRKRGKTVSSADAKKVKPVALPPMQVTPLPAGTAQRVANLKSSSSSSPNSSGKGSTASSRATAQTISSMHKQSDTSLRSSRNQLPTIAGSPSVSVSGTQQFKESKDLPPSTLTNSVGGLPKETPTKIPRISSRTSGVSSPSLKGSVSTVTGRRASVAVGATPSGSAEPSPTPSGVTTEFGVLEPTEEPAPKASSSHRLSIRVSPSSSTRVPRHVSGPSAAPSTSSTARKSTRDSISFSGLRKSSTSSVTSLASGATNGESSHRHRFSGLSPSRGLKLLSPKMSLKETREMTTFSTHSTGHIPSASSSRQSLSAPSPAPSSVDEEELLGDEEMLQYIRRQQAKKIANGATQEELNELLNFPEPIPPAAALAPEDMLRSSQAKYLSDYEKREVLDYPKVWFAGARSQKILATVENTSNNHGYDDERGDYIIVNHDHLAYRYEVQGTLGKGSFGQVLRCRDHCTGEAVAVKILRNKKRFHHQALVEIKILENLRKWDPDEKHRVIKMTEHFNFRGHLCIAMELLSINLYELIKANGFVGFTTALIRRFTSQMLLSLSLMRRHRIVHCDLKPENVLLKHPAKSALKMIDFGSSCFEHEKIYTYIQSRFYRSPEVILGMNYHMAIDMWSLGCILAELYTGFPIFPGENEQEQLSCIMEVLGIPDKSFVEKSSRKRLFFDSSGAPRPVVNSKGRRRRPATKSLAQVLRCDDEYFVDFIAKCLIWDPERRLKPQQALQHPFITNGRRTKITAPSAGAARALLSSASSTLSTSSRSKPTETPKKSLIGAPTPLTARSSRGNASTIAATPSAPSIAHSTLGSTSRSYRASQSQTFASYSSKNGATGFAL